MNKFIILYPEILSSVIRNKEEDLFCIWLLCKHFDSNNSGLFQLSKLIELAQNNLKLNSNHIYKKIKDGVGLYWRNPSGTKGNKIVGLLSLENIVKRLNPQITKTKPFKIDTSYFLDTNTKELKKLFISLVAGRYEDKRPISISTLVENLGISESSIRNFLKDNHHVLIKSNFMVLDEFRYESECYKSDYFNPNDKTIKVYKNDDKFQVLRQLSNSYIINEFDRLSYKKRPKILRKYDRLMLDNLQPKLYNINETKKTINNYEIVSFSA